jgi:ligand-binding sensor protein
LNSKESMAKYLFLTERYSGAEIFGNFLGNDIKEISRTTKFFKKVQQKPRRKIRRRGPKDKGSRRELSGSIIAKEQSRDIFLQIEEEKKNREENHIRKLVNRILEILEISKEFS